MTRDSSYGVVVVLSHLFLLAPDTFVPLHAGQAVMKFSSIMVESKSCAPKKKAKASGHTFH